MQDVTYQEATIPFDTYLKLHTAFPIFRNFGIWSRSCLFLYSISIVPVTMTWNFIEVTDRFTVATVTSLWAGVRKNRYSIPGRVRRCSSPQESSDRLRFPLLLLFSGYLVIFFFGIKRPQHEAGHFRPSFSEVKNRSRHSFTSHMPSLRAWEQLYLCWVCNEGVTFFYRSE